MIQASKGIAILKIIASTNVLLISKTTNPLQIHFCKNSQVGDNFRAEPLRNDRCL